MGISEQQAARLQVEFCNKSNHLNLASCFTARVGVLYRMPDNQLLVNDMPTVEMTDKLDIDAHIDVLNTMHSILMANLGAPMLVARLQKIRDDAKNDPQLYNLCHELEARWLSALEPDGSVSDSFTKEFKQRIDNLLDERITLVTDFKGGVYKHDFEENGFIVSARNSWEHALRLKDSEALGRLVRARGYIEYWLKNIDGPPKEVTVGLSPICHNDPHTETKMREEAVQSVSAYRRSKQETDSKLIIGAVNSPSGLSPHA